MNYDLPSFYVSLLTGFLASPFGVVAILLAAVLAVCSVVVPSARWVYLSLAIWAATLPINAVGYGAGNVYVPLAFPLEQMRLYARPLTLGFTAMLLLPLLTSTRGWRRHLIGWPLGLFITFEFLLSMRLTAGDITGRGPLNLLSFTLLLLTFGLAVGMWLQTRADAYKLLYAVVGAGALVIVSTCYQLAINRVPILYGGRLAGVTGNPQFLAIILTLTAPTAAYLITHGPRALRPLFALQVAISVLLLMWAGSRTGFLGMVLGMVVLFARQSGRLIISGAVVATLVYFAMPYFEGSAEGSLRFFSTINDRQMVYDTLFPLIANNFWFGSAQAEGLLMENSYLSALADYGIIGSLPLIAAWLAMAYQVVRLQRMRPWLGEDRGMVDLVSAFWVSIAAMAAFEGFLLGVLVFPILVLYCFGVLTAYLRDAVDAAQQPQEAAPDYVDPWQAAA